MAYVSLQVHFVWSTAGRQLWIDPQWQDQLYAYLGGIAKNAGAIQLAAGGMPDHVHLLALVPATLTIAELVNKYKSNSSKWIHETFPELQDFRWQTKYGAFGVSQSMSPTVKNYLHHQAEHHRQRSYLEELTELLERHGIEWDERYLGE